MGICVRTRTVCTSCPRRHGQETEATQKGKFGHNLQTIYGASLPVGYYNKPLIETTIVTNENADTLETWALNALLHVGGCFVVFLKRDEGHQKETNGSSKPLCFRKKRSGEEREEKREREIKGG